MRAGPKNPDKVFWPDEGLTKADLYRYFEAVAPFVLPVLRDRPLTLKRYPDGIHQFSFFQKNTPDHAPPWVRTIGLRAESANRTVRYAVCNSSRTLLWLADQATIELHPFLSRTDRLDRPDYLVIDVDPPEGAFDRAVRAALTVRDVLEDQGLRGVAKTSGAKGVHVYVPLRRTHGYDIVREAARRVAELAQQRAPGELTTDVRRAKRGGRVFLDAGRVAPGAHVVATYSPRARPGATVSFPVGWKDLTTIRPGDFTISTVPRIVAADGDAWRQLMPARQTIPPALRSPE